MKTSKTRRYVCINTKDLMRNMVTAQKIIDLETLKRLRAEKEYSVSDMADMLGYKTPTGYWLIEQGKRKVSIDTLYRLSRIYGCHMEDLITDNTKNR